MQELARAHNAGGSQFQDFSEPVPNIGTTGHAGPTREMLYERARREVGDKTAKKWLDAGMFDRPALSGRVWDGDTGELIKG